MSIIRKVALLTGATGFIGSNIAMRLLLDGWKVHVLCRDIDKFHAIYSNENFQAHELDGSTTNVVEHMRSIDPSVVFHLASYFVAENSSDDVEKLINSNIKYGTQILNAMDASGIRNIINTSTSWQHHENEEYNPVCLYAATKQAFEAIMEFYIRSKKINAITLELFDTYGVGDRRNKLFRLLDEAAISGRLLSMSKGEQLIDLVYIDDVVNAYLISAERLYFKEKNSHERFSVSSGSHVSLKTLVELYCDISKKKINIYWGGKPYRDREVMTPSDCVKILPNWSPKINISDGLSKIAKQHLIY